MIKVPDEDSFEPFENLRQMEALKDLEEPMCEYKPRNCFEEAMSKLSETAIPKNIPCRSKEKEKVREFLLEGIKKLGVNQTLCMSNDRCRFIWGAWDREDPDSQRSGREPQERAQLEEKCQADFPECYQAAQAGLYIPVPL